MENDKLTELPFLFRELLAAHQAFHQLGFDPSDLMVQVGIDIVTQKKTAFVSLYFEGSAQFNFKIGALRDLDEKEFFERWPLVAELFNRTSDEEAKKLWEGSYVRRSFMELAFALKAKGIQIPVVEGMPAPLPKEKLS